jgi:lipopolysaccharide/colanic/teichoic acid biosynthesis glycosyltransferase
MISLKPIFKHSNNSTSLVQEKNLESIGVDSVDALINDTSTPSWTKSTYLFFKSIIDRLSAFLLTIILSPALLLISLGILLDSPGHPIFSQERIGKNGRKFVAYKFRTMYVNNDDSQYKEYLKQYILRNAPYKESDKGEKIYKLVDDPRITRLGAILRKSNLDELPQLINLIKGEMSFIGPRPDVPFSVSLYNDWHRKRLSIKPGISGMWQVCHRKGLSFNDMVKLDLEYVDRISPILDVKIVILTIRTILIGDGS